MASDAFHKGRDDKNLVDIGRIQLAYRASGPRNGQPLVLLPALGETSSDWDIVTPAFARHWRVYAVDLRGHGRSDWPGDYSLELMQDDVLGFLDALALDHVDLIGHSLGGGIAYLLAARAAHRVGRLVLEEPPPPFPRERPAAVRPDGPLNFDWAVVAAVRPQLDQPDPSWLERLDAISAPTLIVGGGSSSHIPHQQLMDMARRIRHSHSVTIPVGHEIHRSRPSAFIAAVLAFLQQTG
jgi:pimeloyl-ACP methyl ester carboxylesterase